MESNRKDYTFVPESDRSRESITTDGDSELQPTSKSITLKFKIMQQPEKAQTLTQQQF